LNKGTHFYQFSKSSAIYFHLYPVPFHVAICLRTPNRKLLLLLASTAASESSFRRRGCLKPLGLLLMYGEVAGTPISPVTSDTN
jgi:hypothetical protein